MATKNLEEAIGIAADFGRRNHFDVEITFRSGLGAEHRQVDEIAPVDRVLMSVPEKRLLSVTAAAKYIGVSRSTLYRLEDAGKIVATKAFGLTRFDIRDLDAAIEAGKVPQKDENQDR